MSQQLAILTRQLVQVKVGAINFSALIFYFCGGNHMNGRCEVTNYHDQVNYIKIPQGTLYNPYANIYNTGWGSHPNFPWNNKVVQGPLVPPYQPTYAQPSQEKPSRSKLALEKLSQKTSNFV